MDVGAGIGVGGTAGGESCFDSLRSLRISPARRGDLTPVNGPRCGDGHGGAEHFRAWTDCDAWDQCLYA